MNISIIVPCFNEEESLPVFYGELSGVLQGLGRTYEIIYINDGSSDRTLEIIRGLAAADRHVRYISFSRNFGKEAAMYAGFCNASGDYVAVMDADLQDPPSLLPKMLEILELGDYDSVATRRRDRKGEPPVRSFFAHQFYKLLNRISDANVVDGARDYRLMKKAMVKAIVAMAEYNRFSKGIFGWVGFRTCWISYDNVGRIAGKSKWSFWKLFRYGLDGIVNFSQAPLVMASWLGILMSVIGFVSVIFIVVRKLIFGDPVAGWASTMCVIVFLGGIQLFCMGIMGQYLAKIHTETKHRPHYIASETNIPDGKLIN